LRRHANLRHFLRAVSATSGRAEQHVPFQRRASGHGQIRTPTRLSSPPLFYIDITRKYRSRDIETLRTEPISVSEGHDDIRVKPFSDTNVLIDGHVTRR
jgi:hypothetical protein